MNEIAGEQNAVDDKSEIDRDERAIPDRNELSAFPNFLLTLDSV